MPYSSHKYESVSLEPFCQQLGIVVGQPLTQAVFLLLVTLEGAVLKCVCKRKNTIILKVILLVTLTKVGSSTLHQ